VGGAYGCAAVEGAVDPKGGGSRCAACGLFVWSCARRPPPQKKGRRPPVGLRAPALGERLQRGEAREPRSPCAAGQSASRLPLTSTRARGSAITPASRPLRIPLRVQHREVHPRRMPTHPSGQPRCSERPRHTTTDRTDTTRILRVPTPRPLSHHHQPPARQPPVPNTPTLHRPPAGTPPAPARSPRLHPIRNPCPIRPYS